MTISKVKKPTVSKARQKGTSVNKPHRGRSVSPRKTSRNRRETPAWVYRLWATVAVVLFVVGFYFLAIRPFAYRWQPCGGYKAYGVCMPLEYRVHGIDVSHYQGSINWNALQKTREGKYPIEFVFVKSTEGGDYLDDKFHENFDSARVHGFMRGAYHFYNPKTDASKQADFFIEQVKLLSGDLPPVLDIERSIKDKRKLQNDIKIWLNRVENYYGVKPIIYASYKFKTKYLTDSIFDTYPYWIAHYYVDSISYDKEWKFWQHTDVGTLPGIKERVDLNVFNGSIEDLRKLTLQPK